MKLRSTEGRIPKPLFVCSFAPHNVLFGETRLYLNVFLTKETKISTTIYKYFFLPKLELTCSSEHGLNEYQINTVIEYKWSGGVPHTHESEGEVRVCLKRRQIHISSCFIRTEILFYSSNKTIIQVLVFVYVFFFS